jgi:hypothetical protein
MMQEHDAQLACRECSRGLAARKKTGLPVKAALF